MKKLLRPTLIITFFTLLGLLLGFLTQMVIAAQFGAGSEMDAFLASTTLPNYLHLVLMVALGFGFLPVFVELVATGRVEEAWHTAGGVITLALVLTAVLALAGSLWSGALIDLSAPGLTLEARQLAAEMMWINWIWLVCNGLAHLLTGLHQAQGRFGWPAVAPLLGTLLRLLLVIWLCPRLGAAGLAWATAGSVALQAGLLWAAIPEVRLLKLNLDWGQPGVMRVLRLFLPLALANLLVRWDPLVERYLASGLGEGAIARLGYANRLNALFVALASSGIATVAFPTLAQDYAVEGASGLRRGLSAGLRTMWLAVAPLAALGVGLALPLVQVTLQRGVFTLDDSQAVAWLLQIYLISAPGACLAAITGRSFYTLQDTRTPALVGVVGALLYGAYAWVLARWLGAPGIALAYVLYNDLDVVCQVWVLRRRMGGSGGEAVVISFIKTGLAAGLGGLAAWGASQWTQMPLLQLGLGGCCGLAVCLLTLVVLRSNEAAQLWNTLRPEWSRMIGK
jgi:putative peptidoglycan lipid II flippase